MASKLINIDQFKGKSEDFVAFCQYFHSQNVTPIAHEKLIKIVFDYLQSLPETMGQIVKRLNTANVQFPPCPLFNVAVIKK
jgi:hypothetical protein